MDPQLQKSRRACAWMLAFSLCLRLAMALGLDDRITARVADAAGTPEFSGAMVFLETGQVPEPKPDPEPRLWVVHAEPSAPDPSSEPEAPAAPADPVPPPAAPAPLAWAPAEQLSLSGGCTYDYDPQALLARPSSLDFSGPGPKILIVHTHGSEAYTPSPGLEYDPGTAFRTQDPRLSVIAVGEALCKVLNDRGYETLHDTAINDYPSYNDSYWTTLGRIEDWLVQYPSLQMVLDIHRDAVEGENGPIPLSCSLENRELAQVMLVIGTDQGGLDHPNWPENLANALKLQAVLQARAPGLCRHLDLRTERFNQHMTPGSMLVEIGTHGNTLPQALASAELLGSSLADLLDALRETGGTLPD